MQLMGMHLHIHIRILEHTHTGYTCTLRLCSTLRFSAHLEQICCVDSESQHMLARVCARVCLCVFVRASITLETHARMATYWFGEVCVLDFLS